MPQMNRMRSSDFCMGCWWNTATSGAVRGTSTTTCTPSRLGAHWLPVLVLCSELPRWHACKPVLWGMLLPRVHHILTVVQSWRSAAKPETRPWTGYKTVRQPQSYRGHTWRRETTSSSERSESGTS